MGRAKDEPRSGELFPYNGKRLLINDLALLSGIPPSTIRSRIEKNYKGSVALAVHLTMITPHKVKSRKPPVSRGFDPIQGRHVERLFHAVHA